jgi:nicotinamide mononucleotide transporter
MNFFDIQRGYIEIWGYTLSYLELFGTLTGAFAVWLEARAKVLSWPIGIVSVVLLFFLFFQVQLYPDMFLQIFFFGSFVLGWWRWTHPREGEGDYRKQLRISLLARKELLAVIVLTVVGTLLLGSFASRLHTWLPTLFSKPSAFPYLDSFVTVLSVINTFLVIQKKIENWIFWIAVDAVAAVLYVVKGIAFLGFEYFIFCLIAVYGLRHWLKVYRSYTVSR